MDFLTRIGALDKLIQQKSTGSPASLARRLNVSERTVFNYLRWMKRRGAPITYSREEVTYLYKTKVEFVVAFVRPEIKEVIERVN